MSLQLAEQVANAVMYEGYVLYPYRASAAKNRYRWQVGLVMPRAYVEATGSDTWFMQTDCVVEIRAGATVTVTVRGLHLQQRTIDAPGAAPGSWRTVDSLWVDGRQLLAWDEGVEQQFVRDALPVHGAAREWRFPLELAEAVDEDEVRDASGRVAARIVRRRAPVAAIVRVTTVPCGAFVKLRVRVENLGPVTATGSDDRHAALRHSLAGAHTLLAVENGEFVSMTDPLPTAEALVATCDNQHTWPVLIGPPGSRRVMLSSPIILSDYPAVAPESPGDFCDATEIDEMLMLRLQTLTEEEKRQGRATDARAERIIDRGEAASADLMDRLHGAVRHCAAADVGADERAWDALLNPPNGSDPEAAWIDIGTVRVAKGSRVRLTPTRRADSLDLCLAGRIATVTGVYRTLENEPYVSVVPVDDPAGMGGALYRRALFFHPDELEPVG